MGEKRKKGELRSPLVVRFEEAVVINAEGLLALLQLVFSRPVAGLDDGSLLALLGVIQG